MNGARQRLDARALRVLDSALVQQCVWSEKSSAFQWSVDRGNKNPSFQMGFVGRGPKASRLMALGAQVQYIQRFPMFVCVCVCVCVCADGGFRVLRMWCRSRCSSLWFEYDIEECSVHHEEV